MQSSFYIFEDNDQRLILKRIEYRKSNSIIYNYREGYIITTYSLSPTNLIISDFEEPHTSIKIEEKWIKIDPKEGKDILELIFDANIELAQVLKDIKDDLNHEGHYISHYIEGGGLQRRPIFLCKDLSPNKNKKYDGDINGLHENIQLDNGFGFRIDKSDNTLYHMLPISRKSYDTVRYLAISYLMRMYGLLAKCYSHAIN